MKENIKKEYSVVTKLLYRLRINSGLTQLELADLIKAPQSFVSKIESGERRVDIIELREICHALNSNLIEFCTTLEKELNETKPEVLK